MAQLGARLNGIEKVVGSSPTRSTGLIKEPAEMLALFVKNKSQGKSSRLSCQRDRSCAL